MDTFSRWIDAVSKLEYCKKRLLVSINTNQDGRRDYWWCIILTLESQCDLLEKAVWSAVPASNPTDG